MFGAKKRKIPDVKRLVQELVNDLHHTRVASKKAITSLELLKQNHREFWYKLQEECEKNGGHSTGAASYKIGITYGQTCCYCRAKITSPQSAWNSRERERLFNREDFETWTSQNTNEWPEKKKQIFIKGNAEIEKFFTDYYRLHKTAEELTDRDADISQQLDEIWLICENELHKTQDKPVASIYDGTTYVD